MISIKKSLDELELMERRLHAGVECYLSLIECLETHPAEIHPDLSYGFRTRLKQLRRTLGAQPEPKSLHANRSRVEGEVRDYAVKAAELLAARDQEVKKIIEILAEAASTLTAKNDSHNYRLAQFTKELEGISRLPTLEGIRKKLSNEVRELKTFVATIGDDQRVSMAQLRSELSSFRTRLQEAERLAFSDALTGIANRAEGDKQLRACASSGKPFSVFIWDLNDFKQINDGWGHQAGDYVLKNFARLLAQHVRAGDTVCRWGGDEFLVVLPDCRLSSALKRAKTLSPLCCGVYPLQVDGSEEMVEVAAAVGVAEYIQAEPLEDLLARADKFLYREKKVPLLRAR